ncbi:MAG: S8 family serine peptidase [Alphaproteobacteria bacterium]|nr:S8 family serine peptidase [Alphaproteobacteria bacterium]MBU2083939.1 S8 family serine peptidase [Alphaproteobacteria bacterium]MBU2142291.1 S8 family serine peptidase [Alphaproteobacteria bacterium]MBU2196489.1 S8 family serine peptidase [Alphaproteobacteria bacterium]
MAEGHHILIKTTGLTPKTGFRLTGRDRETVSADPLFTHIQIKGAAGPGITAAPRRSDWLSAEIRSKDLSAWDICHALVDGSQGVAGRTKVEFAEPDIEHNFSWASETAGFSVLSGQCGAPKPQVGNPFEAIPGDDFWFLGEDHSQLLKARLQVKAKDRNVGRIAHIDTGYDPSHHSLPRHLRVDLQRNFRDDDRPYDAQDERSDQILANLGHGVGTLSLLAGKDVLLNGTTQALSGGADLDIVPIRVANWVVKFRTSALAKAFDYVYGLRGDPETRCDVITLSMGGIASAAWADAVNALYDEGILLVAAGGNNFGNFPTKSLVYPARFDRVLAACGVMAGGSPYANIPGFVMQGCYGPARHMTQAMAAYTPNVPWARFGCPDLFDRDGKGTSCATPQIASAAALWMHKHRTALGSLTGAQAWKRAELARHALYQSSAPPGAGASKIGRGHLKAADALALKPADLMASIERLPPDRVSFPLFKVLTGRGITPAEPGRLQMLELEAAQLSQTASEIETALDALDLDDPSSVGSATGLLVLEALADHPAASKALKSTLGAALGRRPQSQPSAQAVPAATFALPDLERMPGPPLPQRRRIQIYATDPLAGTRFEDFHLTTATITVPWEADLKPGPVGEYVEVVDVDPASDAAYLPVDLNHPALLANDGYTPTEGHPQFHQQMVYAVSMRTIELFETALGRRALWPEHLSTVEGEFGGRFVRRLRLYPHALREANAYYSPTRKAVLFGYFRADETETEDQLPGGTVFTALSHDIIAHEVSHALLDGLHPRFNEASNADMWAFHEAFSDIIALFQHFTIPEALEDQIMRHRGDLSLSTMLGALALQFGQAIGYRGALRNAIARKDKADRWHRIVPSKDDYQRHQEPHLRGQVLVSAIFDAFLNVYEREARDFIRLATHGSGVLPPGEIPPLLARKLSELAARISGRVVSICIRALDYCPPIDLTFGEYLRALITADRELVPDDACGYRVAFVSAFRARGIYPEGVANLSEDTLTWQAPYHDLAPLEALLAKANVDWDLRTDRLHSFTSSNKNAEILRAAIKSLPENVFSELGMIKRHTTAREERVLIDQMPGKIRGVEVHSVRPATRVSPEGRIHRELIVELTQTWTPDNNGNEFYRGGSTIIVDADTGRIKFVIRKRIGSRNRTERERSFRSALRLRQPALNYIKDRGLKTEPFALLHGH